MTRGGTHRYVAEQKIVVPGPDDRGDWTEGFEHGPNLLPVVLESNAFSALRVADKSNLTTRYREHVEVAQATNLTGRKGLAINNALVVGINEYERVKDQAAALRELIQEKDAAIHNLADEVAFLRGLIKSSGGQGLVPSNTMREAAE